MKKEEQEDLRRSEVGAREQLPLELAALRRFLERLDRKASSAVLPSPRREPRSRLGHGLPGWDHVVPSENVQGRTPTVTCRCGHETILTIWLPMACGGGCGRYFLRTFGDVRVKKFELSEQA